jgi:hypothetical protein
VICVLQCSFRRDHAGRQRPAPHAGKTRLRLSVLCTRVGAPTPRGVAGLRGVFRAITTACSERRRPSGMLATERCPVRLRRDRPAGSPTPAQAARTPQVEIGRSEAAAVRSSQCVRVAAKQVERFLPPGTCRCESAATRCARRQGSDAEADFRRAAPAAAGR